MVDSDDDISKISNFFFCSNSNSNFFIFSWKPLFFSDDESKYFPPIIFRLFIYTPSFIIGLLFIIIFLSFASFGFSLSNNSRSNNSPG